MSHRAMGKGLFLNFDNAIIFDKLACSWVVAMPHNSLCGYGLDVMPFPGITVADCLIERPI
jgi:hypothetical protein